MSRRQPRKIGVDLSDESWSIQNEPRPSEEDRLNAEPFIDSEVEFAAVAEALAPGREKLQSMEYGRFLALHYSLLQNSRITFLQFVKTRFIPEHVSSKGPAGQRHYHAILKHILRPETADALFDPDTTLTNKRLIAIPDWPYLDDVRLCDIETGHVQRIISGALDKGYSVQTVKHIRNVIGTIITHATRRRYFSGDNPAFLVPLPPMTRRRDENLTLDQARQLLGLMKHPEREIALIAVFTGLHIEEICRLQWKQVNLTESPCLVDGASLQARSIALRKQGDDGKSGLRSSRVRAIEISGLVVSVLAKISQKGRHTKTDDFVFSSRSGNALWPANLELRLKSLGGELGIPWLSWDQFTKAHKTLSSQLAMESFGPAHRSAT